METRKTYYRMDRKEIAFLKFLLEAYEGIGTITTLEREKGIVLIRTADGCEPEVADLLSVMAEKGPVIPMEMEEVMRLGLDCDGF